MMDIQKKEEVSGQVGVLKTSGGSDATSRQGQDNILAKWVAGGQGGGSTMTPKHLSYYLCHYALLYFLVTALGTPGIVGDSYQSNLSQNDLYMLIFCHNLTHTYPVWIQVPLTDTSQLCQYISTAAIGGGRLFNSKTIVKYLVIMRELCSSRISMIVIS